MVQKILPLISFWLLRLQVSERVENSSSYSEMAYVTWNITITCTLAPTDFYAGILFSLCWGDLNLIPKELVIANKHSEILL
jgi:hypothetical protein